MTTTDLTLTGTRCAWCREDVLDEHACPNDPTVCADCCPCHGDGLDDVGVYSDSTSTITFLGHTEPLSEVVDWLDGHTPTPHRVALVLRDLFGMTASDEVALAVYDALMGEVAAPGR